MDFVTPTILLATRLATDTPGAPDVVFQFIMTLATIAALFFFFPLLLCTGVAANSQHIYVTVQH